MTQTEAVAIAADKARELNYPWDDQRIETKRRILWPIIDYWLVISRVDSELATTYIRVYHKTRKAIVVKVIYRTSDHKKKYLGYDVCGYEAEEHYCSLSPGNWIATDGASLGNIFFEVAGVTDSRSRFRIVNDDEEEPLKVICELAVKKSGNSCLKLDVAIDSGYVVLLNDDFQAKILTTQKEIYRFFNHFSRLGGTDFISFVSDEKTKLIVMIVINPPHGDGCYPTVVNVQDRTAAIEISFVGNE
jgi:hypothetical protein